MNRLLIALLFALVAVACSQSNAANNNPAGGNSTPDAGDNGTPGAGGSSSGSGVAYAPVVAIFDNQAGNAEVFRSVNGKTWSAPSTGIEGAYLKHVVVDNSTMLVLTDKGLYHSKNDWKTFTLSRGYPATSSKDTLQLWYIGGNRILFYDSDMLLSNLYGGEENSASCPSCSWDGPQVPDPEFGLNIVGKTPRAIERPMLIK